jgi:hypothetical protein
LHIRSAFAWQFVTAQTAVSGQFCDRRRKSVKNALLEQWEIEKGEAESLEIWKLTTPTFRTRKSEKRQTSALRLPAASYFPG